MLRDRLTNYKTSLARKRGIRPGNLEFIHRCKYCGVPLRKGKSPSEDPIFCNECTEIRKREVLSKGNAPGFRWTETALAKHSGTSRARRLEILAWEAQFSESELPGIMQNERQRFIVEIFPSLQSFTVTRISKQVGISLRYASLIKKGLSIPRS